MRPNGGIRSIGVARCPKRIAQIELGFRPLGLESHGAAIGRDRFLQVAMRLEDVPEIVMGASIRAVECDCAPKKSDRF